MRLALFQPDIAGNVGTIMRLCACFGVPLDIVLPCGFPCSDKQLKRSAMDYGASAESVLHTSFDAFQQAQATDNRRLILLSSHADTPLPVGHFTVQDTIILGSESAGAPDFVHAAADLRLRIPMLPGFRSLNIAVAAGIALSEALRQTGTYPA